MTQKNKLLAKRSISILFLSLLLLSIIVPLIKIQPVNATSYFNNGFEEGNVSAWTGANGDPAISSTASTVYNGTYSLQINADSEDVYASLGATRDNMNASGMFYFTGNLPASNGEYCRFFGLGVSEGTIYSCAELYNNGSGTFFVLNNGYWDNRHFSNVQVELNTWYEVHLVFNKYSGKEYLFLDGIEIASGDGSGAGVSIVQVGIRENVNTVYYADCIKTGDIYQPKDNQNLPPPKYPICNQVQIKGQKAGATGYVNVNWSIASGATLSQSILCWNITGTYTNTSLALSGVSAWANYSATMPSNGTIIRGWVYAQSNESLWTQSGNFTYQVYSNDYALYVDGNKILNGSGNNIAAYNGVNYADFNNNPNGNWILPDGSVEWSTWDTTALNDNLNQWINLNCQTVRTHLSCKDIYDPTFISHYKYFVSKCLDNGIYVLLDFYSTNSTSSPRLPFYPYDNNQYFPNASVYAQFIGNLTLTFRDYPNIIYEPWNEPLNDNSTNFAAYQNMLSLSINQSRQYSNCIFTYSLGVAYRASPEYYEGMGWADYPVTDLLGNLRYTVHIYRMLFFQTSYGGSNNLYTYASMLQAFNFTGILNLAAIHPVMGDEFGYDMWQEDGHEAEWMNNTGTIMKQYNIGFCVWWWKSSNQQYATLVNGGVNYELNIGGTTYFTLLGLGDSYISSINITSPTSTTYTSSSVSYSITYTGNDTGPTYQINAYKSGIPIGSNLTSTSGSLSGLTNGTYTFAVSVIGVHGSKAYKTVSFTIAIPTASYPIIATAGAGGTITPSGTINVVPGSNQTFTITPNIGYHATSLIVDGSSAALTTSYTFYSVSTSHTITANFAINTSTITASADANSGISPSGAVIVNYGSSQSFSYSASTGYQITTLTIDGVPTSISSPSGTYVFSNVIVNHTISVTSEALPTPTPTPTPTAGPSTSSSPNPFNHPTQVLNLYFRSDTYNFSTISAYGLDTDYTNSYVSIPLHTTTTNASVTYGFRIYLAVSATEYREVTSGTQVGLITVNGNFTGQLAASWLCPDTSVVLGSEALKIDLYARINNGSWTIQASYVSNALMTKELMPATWSFTLNLVMTQQTGNTTSVLTFGDSNHRSTINGITIVTPNYTDIQGWQWAHGDIIGLILGSYLNVMGGAFYILIFLGIFGSLWFRHRSVGPVVFIVILLGGGGGLSCWILLPAYAAAIFSVLIILAMMALIFKVIR